MGAAVAWVWRERAGTAYGPGAEGERDPDPDGLEALGDEIATLAAHIHAATARLLALLGAFDRRRGWEAGGHRGCAEWLAWRTGMDAHTAREHVRVARALEGLPETRASMARGRLSFSKVRALTRVATAESESELLALAEGTTTARLERRVRAWRRGSREEEATRERELHRLRRLSVFPDGEGMYVIRGRLEPEVGALLRRAIEAASDALWRQERREEGSDREGTGAAEPVPGVPAGTPEAAPGGPAEAPPCERDTGAEAARRRHDALALVAERALAAGLGEEEAPISGTRAGRYEVLLYVEAATLLEGGEGGRSELADGTRVPAGTSRRLACDAAVRGVTEEGEGRILSVGRRRRTIPPALRRALEVRDGGCRFPGCGLRHCDAHHVLHWADGGETSLANTVLLCRHHHRLVHEEGWRVQWWGKERVVFRDPKGGVHLDAAREAPALSADPVAALVRRNRLRGADPGPLTAAARWRREGDVPDRVLFAATEAGIAGAETRRGAGL